MIVRPRSAAPRVLAALFLSTALLAAAPLAAQAAGSQDTLHGANTYGSYSCSMNRNASMSSVKWACDIGDTECDSYGVYVEARVYLGDRGVDDSGWYRLTDNAGGCGHHNFNDGKITNGVGTRDVEHVYLRLCKDIPHHNDSCWDGTVDGFS